MKKALLALIILASCSPKITDLSVKSVNEIAAADIAMSDLAAKIGFNQALLAYADDNVIKPQENRFPVIGRKNLSEFFGERIGPKTISWAPYRTEAARSGDFGYSVGKWTLALKDTTMYGEYYTIWKKLPDGKWKFVLDGGNGTPKPKQ
ncbi:MAG: hypothetical protein NVS3B19_07390 [Ginsengibacter sp.]